jgi:phosphoribosylformimino-5-aminoimidazole carboxamide ribotide isomerase
MLILPAVDIKGGKAVRLFQGHMDQAKVYADTPADMAKRWEDEGAQYLHVVDLDGAFAGYVQNMVAIDAIIKRIKIPIEVGGGVRNIPAVRTLIEAGVARVIMGTVAIRKPHIVEEAVKAFGAERITIGIDAQHRKVMLAGWAESTAVDYITLAKRMHTCGIRRIIYTDIEKDGALEGPNIAATRKLAQDTGLKIIASGGITTKEDVAKVKALEKDGVEGMIVGKALYEGKIKLKEIL